MTEAELTLHDDNARVTIAKLNAQTRKFQGESLWFPFVATAVIYGAAFAVVKLFLAT